MIRIAICDDDKIMLDYLEEKIREYYAETCEIKKYEGGESLLSDIRKQLFDVLFLDIDMPGMDGIALAERIRDDNQHIKILFVTNKDSLVYETFKYAPFRYIRKTHIDEELERDIKDLKKVLTDDSRTGMFVTELGDVCIKLKEIIFAEIYNHTLTIHTKNRELEICKTLDDFEKEIGDLGFIRVHKSYLVNYRYIRSFSGKNVVLDNNKEIPVSKRRIKDVKLKYQLLSRNR